MLKKLFLTAAVALCGLTLALAPARSAHAATTQPVTFQVTDIPFFLAWVDSGNGTAMSQSVAKTFHDQYVNSTWTIDGANVKVTGSDGKPLLTAAAARTEDGTAFFPHSRTGGSTLDGAIFRGETQNDGSVDMTKGWTDLYLVLPSKDGKSYASVHLGGILKFGGDGGSTPAPTPDPFGGF